MGVLKNLTDEYFGKTERMEKKIELPKGVVRVNFTDNNGVFHRNGYRVESGKRKANTIRDNLRELIKRLIEKRGSEGDYNDIDVSNVTYMSELFYNDETFTDFNGDISGWDVSNVTNMYSMFRCAEKFNQNISNWDVSNVGVMEKMFCNAESFDQPIGKWKIGGNLKDDEMVNMNSMFWGAESFDQPIGNWDVSRVRDMGYMFKNAKRFNQPIGNWDVSKVKNMFAMFNLAINFNQDISNWNVKEVKKHTFIFDNCPIKDEYKPKKFRE